MTDKITFDTSEELGKKIRDLAQSEFGSLKEAMNHLIEKALNMENKFAFLDDDPCILRDYLGENEAPPKIGEGWYCMKNAPALKILGSGIESAASKICGKCKIKDEAIEDSKTLREQQKKGIVVMIHSCKKGAKANEDMTEMYCPEVGKWRPIMTRKKKTDYVPCRERGTNKARCVYLVSTQTVIKGKLPDGQNL